MNAQSITNLAYESINDKYSRAKYGEFNVIMDMTNGYINATKLCADGDKLMKNWLRNDNNKELIAEFEKNQLNNEPVLFTSDSYGITRGSYVHPLLIPHIASWVSPSFARKVSVIVNMRKIVALKKIESVMKKIDNAMKKIKKCYKK